MPDREKVIKETEDGIAFAESRGFGGLANTMRDVLALLKEQEAEIKRRKRPDCEHANHDGAGCIGYCGCEQDDEPIDACKRCEKYTGNICAEY